jgi:hypothetical protein
MAFVLGACDQPPELETTRSVGFVQGEPSAAYVYAGGLCAPGFDCRGYIQLLFNSELRFNSFSDPPARVHTARVTAQELDLIIGLASSPELAAWVASDQSCTNPGPSESFRQVYVENATTVGFGAVCDGNGTELQSALVDLSKKYFGEGL